MILLLSEKLTSINDWTLERIAAIEKLAQCAFDGSHILAIESPSVAEHLISQPAGTFSAVAIAVLKKLHATYAFQDALLSNDFARLVITSQEALDGIPLGSNGHVSLDSIRDLSLEPTVLLAENLIDAKIFSVAAHHFIASLRLRGVDVACIERGGGGSTIAPEFNELVDSRRAFCLAITDSDRKWPGCGQSAISKQCQRAAANSPNLAGHCELPVRELENLVPSIIFEDIVAAQRIDSAREVKKLIDLFPDLRMFADIKDGVAGDKIFRMPDGCEQRQFLVPVLKTAIKTENYCLRAEDCHGERHERDCTCIAIPKLGEVGEAFHKWLIEQSPHKALERFSEPWRTAWLSVGNLVLRWCCALPARRV